MKSDSSIPFFLSIPHSGEKLPPQAHWLRDLPESVLLCDVDRFVDRLYEPVIKKLNLPCVTTCWHRYVVDLNRKKDEFDSQSVEGAPHPPGKYPKGLHWSNTTLGTPLITKPLSMALHRELVEKYYQPFHDSILKTSHQLKKLKNHSNNKINPVFHLDLHSMPSVGTEFHTDPGKQRAEIVISDFHGQSSVTDFKDLVIRAYCQAGFEVSYNKPYIGGGITKIYGNPSKGHNTIQVELNRSLYMDEKTKQLIPKKTESIKLKLEKAITIIKTHLWSRFMKKSKPGFEF